VKNDNWVKPSGLPKRITHDGKNMKTIHVNKGLPGEE
jgi:hypothetical protein